jgi:hypothetical protein
MPHRVPADMNCVARMHLDASAQNNILVTEKATGFIKQGNVLE